MNLKEFIRSIPLLPMLFWVFYGLPVILKSMGIDANIDAFWGAIITLAISDSAFTAEIYRAGIQSISKGQTAGWFHYIAEPERASIKLTFKNSGIILAHSNRGIVKKGEMLALVANKVSIGE